MAASEWVRSNSLKVLIVLAHLTAEDRRDKEAKKALALEAESVDEGRSSQNGNRTDNRPSPSVFRLREVGPRGRNASDINRQSIS
jgi:hypothetical protein